MMGGRRHLERRPNIMMFNSCCLKRTPGNQHNNNIWNKYRIHLPDVKYQLCIYIYRFILKKYDAFSVCVCVCVSRLCSSFNEINPATFTNTQNSSENTIRIVIAFVDIIFFFYWHMNKWSLSRDISWN